MTHPTNFDDDERVIPDDVTKAAAIMTAVWDMVQTAEHDSALSKHKRHRNPARAVVKSCGT